MKQKKIICKHCNRAGHYEYRCFEYLKEKQGEKQQVVRKPIKAKVDYKWLHVKKEWYNTNRSLDGYYYCHYCGTALKREETTLDHMHPKGNFIGRGRKYDVTNLVPCCWPCNTRKGSMAYVPYCRKYAPWLLKPEITVF